MDFYFIVLVIRQQQIEITVLHRRFKLSGFLLFIAFHYSKASLKIGHIGNLKELKKL